MSDKRYTKEHEYIRRDGETGTVGISHYAQHQLGDVVYVELPEIGRVIAKGAEAAIVESVKAASEVYAPVSGEVIEVNRALEASPSMVNEDPEGEAWFFKLKLNGPSDWDALMTEDQYQDYLGTIS